MMTSDMELVRVYARHGSEEAFATLVSRHVNLVYSVALRQVRDTYLAEEITQAAFIVLARKAGVLGPRTILSAWLCRTAHYAAADALRTQRRRQNREQEVYMQSLSNPPEPDSQAWASIAPLLNGAMANLREQEQGAIVLRFFEGKDLKEVGAAFGISENAANKRVLRALEKLRRHFQKRGVATTAAGIAGLISTHSVQAAPTALAKSITTMAVTKGAASGSTLTLIKGALKIMAWTKVKTMMIAGVAALFAIAAATVAINEIENHGSVGKYPRPWAFVGRATPENAMQSLLWAQSQGDMKMTRDSYSENTWTGIMDYVNNHPNEYRDGLAAANSNGVRNIIAFEILKNKKGSGGVFLKIKKDRITAAGIKPYVSESFLMRIGGEWKLAAPGDSK